MLIAQQVAHQLIRSLRQPLASLRVVDAALADQARRAATSVVLNVAEGNRRVGKDRQMFFRIAAGSAAEVKAALEVAADWGYLESVELGEARGLLDRELALLWGLTHRRA